MSRPAVNQILGDHNVEKQMTDSRGDVAYLMADISGVNVNQIRDIYSALEELSCKCYSLSAFQKIRC